MALFYPLIANGKANNETSVSAVPRVVTVSNCGLIRCLS